MTGRWRGRAGVAALAAIPLGALLVFFVLPVAGMLAEGFWPDGELDLVVLSEVGYFLSPAALEGLVGRVITSLSPKGVVVLCHWRHPVKGWPLDGPEVHRLFGREGLPPVAATYRDRDVEIVVHAQPDQWPDPGR